MVARLLDGCGVPSGSSTSHMTSIAFVRPGSGKSATGCSRQSELEPSAWRVELPSKFQTGRSFSAGSSASSTIFVLLRRFGTGS